MLFRISRHTTPRRQEEFALSQHEIAKQQAAIAEDVSQNIETVAHVQLMLEWIEIFLLSVYAAHLAEMLFFGDHLMVMLAATLGAVASACAVLPHWKQVFSVIAVAAGLFALLLVHHKGVFSAHPLLLKLRRQRTMELLLMPKSQKRRRTTQPAGRSRTP